MKTKSTVLTKEERDILILGTLHGQHLSNAEIGQRLGMSVNKVKTLIHQACIKLGAHNKNEAVVSAVKRGAISLTEFFSLDELAELFCSASPDMLRRIAQLVRQEVEHGQAPEGNEQIICTERTQDSILTKCERDVLILASRGLTNKEIADRLCLANGTVRVFLNRAWTKLGASNRAEAVILALKQREIGVDEIASLNEIVQYFAPSGAESVEKIAQLLDQKLEQGRIRTGS
jgi:DNA-binding CsgD family transcriptional regulator